MLRPKGPIITPDIINPIIPGILTLRRRIGDRSIINNINEKISTGLLSGN